MPCDRYSPTRLSIDSSVKVLLLFGPTASGKTALLEELFLRGPSCRLPAAEVVSADSMQVYRGMDIGTAKPGADLRGRLAHHLLDIRDPSEQYTLGDFVREADRACADIHGRGRLPVVSGGTAFYLKHFLCGLPDSPPSDPAIRAAVARDLESRGAGPLRRELEAGDPRSAARIHPSDVYRLTRAVEVLRRTGRPLSSFAVPRDARPGYDFLAVALERPREELNARIDCRVREMFASGLVEEVRGLLKNGCAEGWPGMQAIGYREFFEARRSGCTRLRDVQAAIARDSRRYARRQLTFFRSLPKVEWRSPEDSAGIRDRILRWYRGEG